MKQSEMPISGDMAIEYTRAVNRINKQMQRLEKAAKGGRKVLEYAYRGARTSIKELFGEYTEQGKVRTRFSSTLPKTVGDYQSVMNAINNFYSKPTSTLTGFKQIYEKRAAKLSELYKTKITPQQLQDLFDSGLWDAIYEHYGSETTMQMAIEVESKRDVIQKKLEADRIIEQAEKNGTDLEKVMGAEAFEELKAAQIINWSSDFQENFGTIEDLGSILERYLKGNAK